jgi:hypothetical protein
MRTRSLLVVASTGQLAAGVAGQRVALRDGRPFDIALLRWRGDPRRVARDSWLFGTGLSAPVVMLAAQAALTTCLAARPSRNATLSLGALGAAMSAGYLVEKEFRSALSPGGWNLAVTPIAATGLALALTMAVLGFRDVPDT